MKKKRKNEEDEEDDDDETNLHLLPLKLIKPHLHHTAYNCMIQN